MNSKNTKTSEVLKQEVLTQLDKVDLSMDEMTTRMTPGQLIDDVIYYPRGGNPAATVDLLTSNPIGATFLTLGTLLLMEDENHISYEQRARMQVSGAVAVGRDRIHTVSSQVSGTVHGVVDGAKSGVSSVRGKVTQLKDKVAGVKQTLVGKKEAAVGMAQDVRTKIQDAKEGVSEVIAGSQEKIAGLTDKIEQKVDGIKDQVTGKVAGVLDQDVTETDAMTEGLSAMSEQERMQTLQDAKAAFGAEGGVSGVGGIAGKAAEVGNKLSSVAQDVGENIPDIGAVKEKAQQLWQSAGETLSSGVSDGVAAARGLDPLTYVAIGAGLGTLTGLTLPVPGAEANLVGEKLDTTINTFAEDLQQALNESSGILKDLVISDMKSMSSNLINRF